MLANTPGSIFCQVCGAANPDDAEYCLQCQHRLLVLSGAEEVDFEPDVAASEETSFEEHLLERISVLEEVVRRSGETLRQLLGALRKQEQNTLVTQTGLSSLLELLDQKGLVAQESWSELWEARMDQQLLALERRDRFLAIRERAAALYHGGRRREFQQLLSEAEMAFFALDTDAGVRALEAAFELDRNNDPLAYFLGEAAFNDGDAERALAFFHQLLQVRPDHYEGLVYCGVIEYERGALEVAEQLLQRAVELYPHSFLPHFSLGAVYAGCGRLTEAVDCLERAIQLDAVPQAFYLLGNCCYELGRLGAAIRHLQKAVQLDPAFAQAYYLLTLAYLDRRWHRKAMDALRRAQELSPKTIGVRYLDGAEGGPLPPVEGAASAWYDQAEKLVRHDNPRAAFQCYREALLLEPDNATLLLSYARLCLRLNRSREIEAVARRVLDLDPDDTLRATACATLIEALRSQGRYREGNRIGLRLLSEDKREATSASAGSPQETAPQETPPQETSTQQESPQDRPPRDVPGPDAADLSSESELTRTVAYSEVAYNLAEMEEDLDQALDFARRSVELSPEALKGFPLAALGWVHYKRKEFDQAIDCLAQSTELSPSPAALTHLGMALLASGQREQARSVLARARSLEEPETLEASGTESGVASRVQDLLSR